MYRQLFIFLALAAFCGVVPAQDQEPLVCPVLDVTAPSQILKPGERARFTVMFEPRKPEWNLKYNWQVSSGKIVSGLGTESIEVEPQIHYVTATVQIGGFRGEEICPHVASETVRWDVRPTAEKIKGFPGEKFEPTIYDQQAVGDVKGWPDHQLHVILGFKAGAAEEKVRERETQVLEWIGDRIDKNRLSIERVFSGVDFTEFWRVPPGAENPVCDKCEAKLCPTIYVKGPVGSPQKGEEITYSVVFSENYDKSKLKFSWTVVGSEYLYDWENLVVTGQGTESVSFKFPVSARSGSITGAVNISGLPSECVNTASETINWDGAPDAVKIGVLHSLKPGKFEAELDRIATTIYENPNNQAYIFVAHKKNASEEQMQAREQLIADGLANGDRRFDRARITLVRYQEGVEIVEFWRVPPGAENPTCKECESPVCPTISLSGPAGITAPGESLTFTATISENAPESARYRWSVNEGRILEGQGTLAIKVSTEKSKDIKTTATLDVKGLPPQCPNKLSETAVVVSAPHPHQVDEFGKLTLAQEKGRLDAFSIQLSNIPNTKGYLVVRFAKGTDSSIVRKRISRFKNHLFVTRQVPKERIVFLVGYAEKDLTVLWILRPGYAASLCPECTVQ